MPAVKAGFTMYGNSRRSEALAAGLLLTNPPAARARV
jgi:hypothetical protein